MTPARSIALDATYSLGRNLSGVGVYSREILQGLARHFDTDVNWEWFYRSNRFFRASGLPPNVRRHLLFDSFGSRSARLFHGLNQRLPQRGFRKQIATFHDLFVISSEYSSPEFRERFAKQARHAAQSSDLVIAVSQFTANQAEEFLGIPQSRIRVIHHGVVPRILPKVPREPIVLCVGAIQKRKNQARLVRAFRALQDDWRLVLAGSEGYGAEETLEAVRNSPARGRITVVGYVPDDELARWYARASLFVFPSLDEGFGMPALEAMAAGVPVIASNRSSMPEICGNGAILVNPCNELEIADAMVSLIGNESQASKLSELGAVRARQFTWKKAIESTAATYKEIA